MAHPWRAAICRGFHCPSILLLVASIIPKVAWGHSQIGELPTFGTLPLVAHKHARTVRACHNLRL
jgi:hypothetical protein